MTYALLVILALIISILVIIFVESIALKILLPIIILGATGGYIYYDSEIKERPVPPEDLETVPIRDPTGSVVIGKGYQYIYTQPTTSGVGLEEILPERRTAIPPKLKTPRAPSFPW